MNNVLDFGYPIHSAAAVVVSSKFFPTWSAERCLVVCFALLEIGEHRPDIMLANLKVKPAQSELKTVGDFKVRFECMLTTAMEVGALVADTTSKWDAKGYKPTYNLAQQ